MKGFDPEKARGVYSALFTPYDRDGKINSDMIGRLVDFHLNSGLAGFYVTGSSGEGLLLTEDERKKVIKAVIDSNHGRGRVIVHVGHVSTECAVTLARFAEQCGADMISSVGPVYYAQSFEGTCRHYRAIAEATGLPFLVYALGTEIVPERDRRLFDIRHCAGLKYTGANFFSVQQLARRTDRTLALFSGFDEMSVAALSFGFHGSIGTSQNFAPKHFVEIYDHYMKGHIHKAAEKQAEINKVIALMASHENRSYQKAIMRYIGYDCGYFRLPYAPLSEQEYRKFASELDRLGIL